MLIKEFCSENFTYIPQAIQNGAKRIELCDNLAVGGTTPSYGVIAEAVAYCHEREIPVMTMIRPRGGNFNYNDTEMKIMQTDLLEAKRLGVDGVVFGLLTDHLQVDKEATTHFCELAEGVQITFHMAFDALVNEEESLKMIDWLAEQGVTRILTHGGPIDEPITTHYARLKKYIQQAQGHLTILPGGGITDENAVDVAKTLNVHEVHGTKVISL